jgi:hypothetical protein
MLENKTPSETKYRLEHRLDGGLVRRFSKFFFGPQPAPVDLDWD